jgi:hypothetical protein
LLTYQPYPPSPDELDIRVRGLIVSVGVGIERASAAFVTGDLQETVRLAETDTETDHMLEAVEAWIETGPAAGSMPGLIATLRVLPQLERALDLVSQIAARARCGPVLPPATRELFTQVGEVTRDMWSHVARAWAGDDRSATGQLAERAGMLANLDQALSAALTPSQSLDPHHAMEGLLVARLYWQLGEEALRLAARAAMSAGPPGR